MDGSTEKGQAIDVSARLAEIKAHMPMTYAEVRKKADAIGGDAYRFVRQGVAGEPNKFYAIEGGRVVGTPFNLPNVHEELARVIAQWGCTFLIMWAPEAQKGQQDGTH